MNKFFTSALVSLGIATAPQVQSSEFGAAAFSPAILDMFSSNQKDLPETQKTQLKPTKTVGGEKERGNIEKSPSKVNKHKKTVKYQVAQIVDDTYIPTTMAAIKTVKTTDCREYKNYRYYFSDKDNIIGTDNFSTLASAQIEKILALPKCKK